MKCIINLDQYCNLLISVLNSLLLRVLDLLYHVCQCCIQFPYRVCNTDTNKDPIKTHSIKVHSTSVILPKDFELMFEHQSFPHLRLNNCLSRWSNTVTCFYTLLGVGRYWSAVHIPCQLDQTNGGFKFTIIVFLPNIFYHGHGHNICDSLTDFTVPKDYQFNFKPQMWQ